MKILVTGTSSYSGTKFKQFVFKNKKEWKIDFLSVRDNNWTQKDFSLYDAVYHVAGMVHVKENSVNKKIFYDVNRDLTLQLAVKAKKEGVKSFVFLSTVAVYGAIGKIGEDTILSKKTCTIPSSAYGKSKLEAETLINALCDEHFKVSILRIPMIYGKDSPGNYKLLSDLARISPFFPNLQNKRSLIYIDNLSDVVCHIIEENLSGLYLICNPKDTNTSEMVKLIAENNDKNIILSSLLGKLIKLIGNNFNVTRKIFGNLTFDEFDRGVKDFKFNSMSFAETIRLSETKTEKVD